MKTQPDDSTRIIDLRALQIRSMQADDPARLAAAFADMNKTRAQYEHYWQENVEGSRVTLIALLAGSVVGYTNVIWKSDYEPFRQRGIPEIHDMNTVTSLRRSGIGTRMLKAAERLVQQTGRCVIGIGVGVTRDYAIAQRLYPKQGYVPDGTGVHPNAWGGCMYAVKQLHDEIREA